jgi:hypothetical protein
MELKFSLTVDTAQPDAVRAELTESKTNGRTVITIAMTLANRIAHQTLTAAQAEVVALAIADLQDLHARLESIATPPPPPAG